MEKLARISVLLLLGIILGAICLYRPFFGLMDDAAHLLLVLPKIREAGIFSFSWQYATEDIAWGMFRPTYPAMIYSLYRIGEAWGPVPMFLVNALFVFGILYLNAAVLARVLKINPWFILLTNFAFFYALDLFQFPSLQEKLVLLFGAALLAISYSSLLSLPKKLLGIFLFTILGVLTKASFCIYLAVGGVALLASAKQLPRKRFLAVLTAVVLVDILGVCFLAFIAKQGAYTTHGYSLAHIVPNLLSIDGLMFLLPTFLFGLFFFRKKSFLEEPEIFIPVVGVLAFLAIFLPWGIKAYVQSVVSPLFSALLVLLAERLFPERRWIWMPALIVLAFTVVLYRSDTMFTRLHDIGNIVAMGPALVKEGVHEIYMPCPEGAHSMENYFKYLQSADVKVFLLKELKQSAQKVVFFDQALCPMPNKESILSGCTLQYLYESPEKRGFMLARQVCPSGLY